MPVATLVLSLLIDSTYYPCSAGQPMADRPGEIPFLFILTARTASPESKIITAIILSRTSSQDHLANTRSDSLYLRF